MFQVYKNLSGDELADLRATLQNGIEAVRGVNAPKMDLIIVLKLGQLLFKRSQDTTKSVERGLLEARTEALFKHSLHLLRLQSNSRSSAEPFCRLFRYNVGSSQFEIDAEINALAEEAITFLAGRYFKNNEYEECIEDFADIRLPFATYFQAESYRKMTELSNTPRKNKRDYLDQARHYLAQTRELLDSPSIDRNHPLKSIVVSDIKRLQQESRKFETSLTDSFVSANGRSDLDDSVSRLQRDLNSSATPTAISAAASAAAAVQNENLERLIREMMQSLSLLKEDVADVRSKVNSIEEQISKQQDNKSVDPLDDYYFIEDELQQSTMNPINNTSMYTNVSRMNTPNAHQRANQPFVQQQAAAAAAAAAAALNSPYSMNQFYNGQYMNPYQTAIANAASNVTPNRNPAFGNFGPMLQCGVEGYMHPQFPQTPPSALLGLMQQQQAGQTPPMAQLQTGSNLPQLQPTIPAVSVPFTLNVAPVLPSASIGSFSTETTQAAHSTPKAWNAAQNNAPVEKGPPGNVVITSSDPLPSQSTMTSTLSQQAPLSVTIPPQHIKANAVPSISTPSKANPTLTALLDKKSEPPKAAVPSLSEQKSIFATTAPKATPATLFSSPFGSLGKSSPEKSATDSAAAKPNPFSALNLVKTTPSEPLKPFSFGTLTQPAPKPAESVAQKEEPAAANVSGAAEEDDYVPTAHFEPVISLPEVAVTTGEENEAILFEHRAKLLRFVKESKEWKDRGIGNMKVLVNKDDPNKVRLLMRREQVLKLCCNQLIKQDTKFEKLPKTDTALSWYGQDFSDNELQVELLAIRFKTADVCSRFHDAIRTAQSRMTDGAAAIPAPAVVKNKEEKVPEKGFGDQFKPKPGSWACKQCYCGNKEVDKLCVVCKAPKDKDAAPAETSAAPAAAPKFNFGNLAAATAKPTAPATPAKPSESAAANGFGDQFKPKIGSWSCKGCYTSNTADTLYCVCCNEPKDDTVPKKESNAFGVATTSASKFSFGNLGAAMATSSTTSSTFSFSTSTSATPPTTGFLFGSAAAPSTAALPVASPTNPINIDDSKSFGFVFQPRSPGNANANGAEVVSDDDNVEEEENTTYFAPVIALPDKVDVKTGEEDENVLYSHRAKLYRFRDAEWKERGLGVVKILQHSQTGRMR